MIRAAKLTDISQLDALEHRCFDYYQLTPKKFKHLITSGNCDLLVVENSAGEIHAYALVLYRRNSKMGRLYSIAVDEQARKQKYGSRLLLEMELLMLKRGCNKIRLEVNSSNPNAIGFYLKHGYVEDKEIANYYPDGTSAKVFSKNLKR